jgi:hypothetical protein
MLKLRPTCEHCNKALPPASTEARRENTKWSDPLIRFRTVMPMFDRTVGLQCSSFGRTRSAGKLYESRRV